MSSKNKYISIHFSADIADDFKDFLADNGKNYSDTAKRIISFFKETGYDLNNPDASKNALDTERIIKILKAQERDIHIETSKRLEAIQTQILEPHYRDFNIVSEYLQKQFSELKEHKNTGVSNSVPVLRGAKEKEYLGLNSTSNTSKESMMKSLEYVLSNFKSNIEIKGDSFTSSTHNLEQLIENLEKVINR